MVDSIEKEFIEKIIRLVDKWSFELCAYCDPGTLISIDGMMDFKCINCGRHMKASDYIGEIARAVHNFREKTGYDIFL